MTKVNKDGSAALLKKVPLIPRLYKWAPENLKPVEQEQEKLEKKERREERIMIALFYGKQVVLFPLRYVHFLIKEDMGIRESAWYAVHAEAINMQSRGTVFELFSWGD